MLTDWLLGLDTAALIRCRDAAFQLAGILSLLWIIGVLGYRLAGRRAPHPVGGDWRRTETGQPLCPPCAEVWIADGMPVAPRTATDPVEAFEKCCCCPAFRAEEDA